MNKQEKPKEFIKTAIRHCIEINRYKMDLEVKEKFLKKIIYKYMRKNDVQNITTDTYKIYLIDENVKIIINKTEEEI